MLETARPPLSIDYAREAGILAEYMDYLYCVKALSKSSAYNYYMMLRNMAKYLKKSRAELPCDVDEVVLGSITADTMWTITATEWSAYLRYQTLQKAASDGNIAVRITVTHGFYRWLAAQRGESPPAFIIHTTRPKTKRKPFMVVTPQMERMLYSNLRGSLLKRNACIICLLLHCGVGLREVADLRLEDLELTAIRVRSVHATRNIPLDQSTQAAINTYLSVRIPPKDGLNTLFVSAKQGRMSREAIEKMIRKAVQNTTTDLQQVTARDLQLTSIQRMVKSVGSDIACAQSPIASQKYFRRAYADAHHN